MDPEEALNAVTEWLPDFLAWADNPQHVDANSLYERGAKQILDDYLGSLDSDSPDHAVEQAESRLVAAEVALTLSACAEWIVANRRH
ncbi:MULTISPECIES: hypothetical protein [unclassified Cryobacterium]|uniref:hypothetical protein n=1 Tax=unclassified Cryobacterium TaxID=2649013 RepID=UPI002AB5BF98|nr:MULTISPECIES: hypothetical protein [unclassified Cryobacterium]MDY7542629.1 hypothetical protein [Cryobacterium sp. 5B3]MEB0264749.1 hypothetical protein [Cryobacterium sp. 10I5]MEB0273721.1 hypothetical protein [Cryobacterium sp. 5B3]